jgi:hypothetical protein
LPLLFPKKSDGNHTKKAKKYLQKAMKKIYYSLTVLIVSILTLNMSEVQAQCAKSIYQAANLGTPPCGTDAQTSVGPGEFVTMDVVAGAEYCISTCGTGWNSQLTGYNGNSAVFFNDNNGPFCQSNEASIQWIATFTGTLDVMVNRFNCQGYQGGGTANSSILRYRQCAPTITSPSADMCPAQCITLTSDQSGGTWSISPNDGSLTGNQFCPIAVGVYTITYTLAACAPTQIINVVTPSVAPTAAVANPTSLCPGGTGAISVIGGSLGTGAQWVWYAGGCGVGSPVGVGATITGTPPTTATYFVRAEGGCVTTACASVTVPVNTLSTDPTSVTASNTSICQGTSATLTVNGGSLGSASNWFWYNGACGGVLVGSGPSITVNPLSSTTYYVRAEGPCNATNCVSISVNVYSSPQVGFNYITTPSACGASDGSISVFGGGGTPPYSWTLNGAPSSTVMTNLSAGPYIIEATDQNGCTDVVSVSMNDPGATPASVVSSDQDNIVCQGDYVTFTASGSYLYTYYINGVPVSTSNPWTTNSLNDGDIVHVQALDFNFCSYTTLGITMTVNPNPAIVMTSNNPTVCGLNDGDASGLVSGGLPPYTYSWSHDVTNNTPAAYSLYAGAYFLTVSDQNGCSDQAVAGLSDPGAAPVTLASSDDDSLICAGENVDFTATGSVDYTFYQSGPIVQGPGTNNVYSTTGLVDQDIVIATGTDANGCTATSNYFTTSVLPGPNVVLVSSDIDNTICTGQWITYTATGALFYQFFLNGVSVAPPSLTDVYQSNTWNHGDVIYVEGTDANHCIVASAQITVTVNPPPTVSVTTQQDPSACGAQDGLVIVTAAGGTSPYNYVWNQDVTHTTYPDAANISNVYAGPYHVNVTDASGCSADATATLSDVGSSPVTLTSSDGDGIICEGETVTFTGTGATTYVFYIDGVVVSTNNPFTTSTLQDGEGVAVVGLDTALCAATSSVIDYVVNPSPFLQIGIVTPPSACGLSDGSITTNTYGGILPYNWTWNGGLPNAEDITGIPAGVYTCIVTDFNGCTDQVSASISDIGAPLATIFASDPDLLICENDTINFLGVGAGGVSPYTFSFFVNGPPAIPGSPDTYSTSAIADNDVVAVTVTDANGCTGTSQPLTFSVTQTIVPSFANAFADICEDIDQVLLPGLGGESPTGGEFTALYNGIEITSDLFFPYGIGDGTHPITYTVDNGNGCFTSVSQDITVRPSPVIDLGADFAICDSSIIVAPGGYVNYDWFPSDLVLLDDSTVIIYNSAHVTVDVTDSIGCIGTGEVNATINHPPILEIVTSPVGAPTEICMGDTVTLCVEGNWATILWSTGSANVACIDVYQNGNIGVTAEDPNGCADQILEGQGMVITVHDPMPIITVNVDDLISSGGFISYQWYLNDTAITVNGNFQTYHATTGGNYYVEVVDQWGCMGQSSVIEHSCVCVGIEENDVNYNLDIFPNPTNGVFTMNVGFELPVDMRLELTNILGQPVINVEDVKNTQNLRRDYNLNHLAQGVYIFTIRTGEQTIVRRVVKN